jgi:hypothetical protein
MRQLSARNIRSVHSSGIACLFIILSTALSPAHAQPEATIEQLETSLREVDCSNRRVAEKFEHAKSEMISLMREGDLMSSRHSAQLNKSVRWAAKELAKITRRSPGLSGSIRNAISIVKAVRVSDSLQRINREVAIWSYKVYEVSERMVLLEDLAERGEGSRKLALDAYAAKGVYPRYERYDDDSCDLDRGLMGSWATEHRYCNKPVVDITAYGATWEDSSSATAVPGLGEVNCKTDTVVVRHPDEYIQTITCSGAVTDTSQMRVKLLPQGGDQVVMRICGSSGCGDVPLYRCR